MAREKTQGGACEKVVHLAVKLVALQPAMRLAPQFAHNVSVWIDRFAAPPKFAPEIIIIDLIGHIQPPAINALFEPIGAHLPQKFAYGRGVGVELGQRSNAPPSIVIGGMSLVKCIDGPMVNVKPVGVGGFLPALHEVVELEKAPAGVVKHAV